MGCVWCTLKGGVVPVKNIVLWTSTVSSVVSTVDKHGIKCGK